MGKRKDKRGRVLNDGEIQRSDGKYAFQYTDVNGKRKTVYSWRLIESDRTPPGKRKDVPLREKEKEIRDRLASGVISDGGRMTVRSLVERYIETKRGVKHKTELSYQYALYVVKNDDFGNRRIDKVKLSDAKAWFIKLQEEGKKYGTIYDIRGVIKPAFQMAVLDDLIRKNPFQFPLSSVIEKDTQEKICLTNDQERNFLDFLKNDKRMKKYYDAVYVLLNTGLRISEFSGLTVGDLNFLENKISVKNQLIRKSDGEYIIQSTKSVSGNREIPMSSEVSECLRRIVEGRPKLKIEPMVGGKSGFLFFNKNGNPVDCHNWESRFYDMVQKYNRTHAVQMPKITPHVCRHTFCSKMARSGMNPKTLQYIMGHSNISITLNVYAHVDFESVQRELDKALEIQRSSAI